MECHKCQHYEDVASGKYSDMEFSKTPCGKCWANKAQWSTFESPSNKGRTHVSVDNCPEHEVAVDPANLTKEQKICVLDISMSITSEFMGEFAILDPVDREILMRLYRNTTYSSIGFDLKMTAQAVEQRHKAAIRKHPFFVKMFPLKRV